MICKVNHLNIRCIFVFCNGNGFGLDSVGIVMRILHSFGNNNSNRRICFSNIGIGIGKENII